MKSYFSFFAPICLAFTFAACKPREPSRSATKADYIEGSPSNDQSWTDSRIISMNNYASDLLNYSGSERTKHNELQLQVDEAMKSAGVKDAAPLGKYILKLGPLEECFGERRGDYGIWWSSHRDQIKSQLEEAARFIRDFHIKMLGQVHGAFSFREVIVCPLEKVGSRMRLDGYQLRIGVPYSTVGNYKPIPNQGGPNDITLMNLWNDGAPIGLDDFDRTWWQDLSSKFSKKEQARNALKAVWRMFNPMSTIRVSLRKLLHESGLTVARRLDTVKSSVPSGGLAALRQSIIDDVVGVGGSGLLVDRLNTPADVFGIYNSLSQGTLNLFIENWKCLATNTEQRGELESEVSSTMYREVRNEKNYIKKAVHGGLVAVVNHHRIGVGIQGSTGSYSNYILVESARETVIETNITAGIVAVDTSDDISVDLNFAINIGRTLPSVAFERAVRAASQNRRLCDQTQSIPN